MSLSTKGGKTTDSLNGKLNFEQDKNRIVGRDEDNLIRLLILADGNNFVIKITPEGVDALTATDDQFIFNSAQNVFKIVDSGVLTVDYLAGSGQGITEYEHGLGFIPGAIVYFTDGVNYQPVPIYMHNSSGICTQFLDWYITSTHLVVRITKNNVAGSDFANASTRNFRFYLLQETAA